MSTFSEKILWKLFPYFEKLGVHVLPVHYYSPIPDTRQLRARLNSFEQEDPMHGIDMNEAQQLDILKKIVASFEQEYIQQGQQGNDFGIDEKAMPSYAPINALSLYAFIRHYKPKKMIEVGSGMSTKVSSTAFVMNQKENALGEFIAIEPYPSAELLKGYEGLTNLRKQKVEEVPVSFFQELGENDILFIDSSHTVKVFGDVNFLFFQVLPQLKPGVIIHIHDIFFPLNYLPHHFINSHTKQIWQEQYLLQAFLCFNDSFEIIYCSSLLHLKYTNELVKYFPWYHRNRMPSSIWIRRKTHK